MARSFLQLLILFSILSGYAQDTLAMEEVYIENELVYKYSDNERFTGVAQIRKKNGRVVFEEVYDDGVILTDYQYYRNSEKNLCFKTEYHRYKLWAKAKEFYYPKSKKWYQITSFDESGKKVLIEQFDDDGLIYSCGYSGRKKHGKEICLDEDGNQVVFEYVNGKKLRK